MKIRFLTAIMGILMSAAVSAQDISKYQYPHHVNISWETEPSTSQSVNWRTNELQKVSFVEYTEATASPFFEKDVKRIEAESENFEGGDDAVWNYHSANITGLKPNTLYSYRVGNGNFWSEWAEFRTATGTNEPFTFLYYGDVQRFILSKGSRAIRQSIIQSPEAKFMLFGGDMVHRGGLNKENWNEFFQTGEWIYQNYPIIGTPRQS